MPINTLHIDLLTRDFITKDYEALIIQLHFEVV